MASKADPDRDLSAGVALAAFDDSPLVAGKIDGDDVVLVKAPAGYFALDGKCTHAGAPLGDGVLIGDTIRCPWHHACFDTRTGAAPAAPALMPLGCWSVEEREGRIFARRRQPAAAAPNDAVPKDTRIVIVGAGAGGMAAAAALVDLGLGATVTLLGDEEEAPYDRTMLTKHVLSGEAGEQDLPLKTRDLAAHGVDLRLDAGVDAIEPGAKRLRLADGTILPFTKLIFATGAEPRRLAVPGAEQAHVQVLRSAADARAIIDAAPAGARVVVVGGSFIGLEAAAALRTRGCHVAVVSPDPHPFVKSLGPALSEAILNVHRRHGTALHLGRNVVRIGPDLVHLDDGAALPADLVVVGIGVRPRMKLAERAGLAVEDGVVVDERLRTSDRDIFAVGDIARWPDPHSGKPIRVEHWVVAQRQGQIAAANAAGLALRYDVVPFFWTLHFDFSVRVVGHTSHWDDIVVEGDPARKNAVLRYRQGGRQVAVATVERDIDLLHAEIEMERRLGAPAATLPVREPE